MRPEQKIIMACRQTGERAERLTEWLEQSRMMLKAQSRSLRIEVQAIATELLAIIEAVERVPTAGILGTWGSSRADLVGALMSNVQSAGTEDETRLSIGRERLSTLTPRDADGGAAAGLRYVAAERAEGPYRFPIRLALLDQLDLVKIIASAYFIHVPPDARRTPTPGVIALRLATLAQDTAHQSFSGMSRRDIEGLRDTLHAAAPESSTLRQLSASGYWDTLGGLIPHLPETARRRALALLWGEDPSLTALFERLSDAIELMGFSGEAYTGLDALTSRDQVSGWIVRHEDSLIAASTILRCHDHPERTIRVSSRHGRAADVERFVLAALADEVRLPVDAASLPLLETADILVLPAPRPVLLWPRADAIRQDAAHAAATQLSMIDALEIFAAQKSIYLTDRAVERHALTSLLVATDPADRRSGREFDAATSAQIAQWVELTQGETAHARERRRTSLGILVTETSPPRDGADLDLEATDSDAGIAATVEAVLDGNRDWAHEWTPNRPFRNVFAWRPPQPPAQPISTSGIGVAQGSGSADILRFERLRTTDDAQPSALELGAATDLAVLQHALTQSTTSTIHLQQLSARLAELRRGLTARFLRLHISNDPLGTVEWRRQICHVARNRLLHSAPQGGFGRLQRALMFTESEAHAVIARLKVDDPRFSATMVPDLRTFEPQWIVAQCLETWIAAMRQTTRAPALMRSIQVPGAIVSHLVDELVLGAMRIGLQEKLTEAVRRIQQNAARAIDCENSIAAIMERGINAYVETLDPAARALRNSIHRDTRFGGGGGVHPPGSAPGSARSRGAAGGGARRLAQPAPTAVAEDWAETFADLIEANILGASLLGGAGHLNRELGEVLSGMSATSFEGFS